MHEAVCPLLGGLFSQVNHSPSCGSKLRCHFLWEAFQDATQPTCYCMHSSPLSHSWSWEVIKGSWVSSWTVHSLRAGFHWVPGTCLGSPRLKSDE